MFKKIKSFIWSRTHKGIIKYYKVYGQINFASVNIVHIYDVRLCKFFLHRMSPILVQGTHVSYSYIHSIHYTVQIYYMLYRHAVLVRTHHIQLLYCTSILYYTVEYTVYLQYSVQWAAPMRYCSALYWHFPCPTEPSHIWQLARGLSLHTHALPLPLPPPSSLPPPSPSPSEPSPHLLFKLFLCPLQMSDFLSSYCMTFFSTVFSLCLLPTFCLSLGSIL